MKPPVSEPDQAAICQILALGCPRATAAKYQGLTLEEFQAILARDDQFMQRVLRAEAAAEVRHMRNINRAAEDEKNWRSSAWWLDRHSELLAEAAAEGDEQLPGAVLEGLQQFAEIIVAEIADVRRRHHVLQHLLGIAAGAAPVAEPVPRRDGQAALPAPADAAADGRDDAGLEEDRP